MRNILTTILLLATLTVAAQNYSPCYKEKYAQGVELYNKGDYNGAKAKFVAAKGCPMPNTAQADEWIKKCNAKLTPAPPKVSVLTDADGNQIFTVGDVTFKMVKVEGGTFEMGCTSEQGSYCHTDETPKHMVTLSEYYIGETEVTQALWKVVMGAEPTYICVWTDEYGRGSTYPAYCLEWEECVQFCNKLNSMLSDKLPPGYKFALPTEAQWEYAARGGNKSQHYKYAGNNTIGDMAWYKDNSGGKTHPVKAKNANELGLYDMSGNLEEWCSDWYLRDYYGVSPASNPQGPSSGLERVVRGGSWKSERTWCRVYSRHCGLGSFRHEYHGFRLSLVHE